MKASLKPFITQLLNHRDAGQDMPRGPAAGKKNRWGRHYPGILYAARSWPRLRLLLQAIRAVKRHNHTQRRRS